MDEPVPKPPGGPPWGGPPLSPHSIDVVLGGDGQSSDVVHSINDVRAVLAGGVGTQAVGPAVQPSADAGDAGHDVDDAQFVPRRRRVWLPVFLFVATCASTFLTGAAHFIPERLLKSFLPQEEPRKVQPWTVTPIKWNAESVKNGFQYAGLVMGLLLAHELGHFVMALRHRVPASLPYFVPFPLSPFGTMGAVIAMDGRQADRRQLFDIGIAGPLAGLVAIVPLTLYAVCSAQDYGPVFPGMLHFHDPLLIQWLIQWLRPEIPAGFELGFTPALAASYIGLLVTGLNMMPVSQLDGGHVIYGLFGRRSHWIARGFVLVAILYMVQTGTYVWSVMLVLVMLIGVAHPRTANDDVPLGPWRWTLGVLSLAIPVLCFPPKGIE